MLPTVWLQPGLLITYGQALDAEKHKHQAIQVVWPNNKASCVINEQEITGALIINSQVEHSLNMQTGWVILVEPQSYLGKQLNERLEALAFLPFDPPLISPDQLITTQFSTNRPDPNENPMQLLSPLFSKLGLAHDDVNLTITLSDIRIQQLVDDLDRCLEGDCLKPASWRAAEIASQLALSEGRFLHLFRQEMNIAWRPYLLWRRLMCAINAMIKGATATEAAYQSGFSDSAHLSRTFRSLFGISIREAQKLIKPR